MSINQWRSLGLFSSEAIRRAQRCEKMLGGSEIKKTNGRLKRIFPSLNGYFMIAIKTEITRRKLFRYASNDCVCEFISEPWEWLHEASSRVSDRIYICNLYLQSKKKNEKIK